MGTYVGEIIETIQKMKKKEIRALEAAKKSNKDNSVYYGARIGMLDEVLDKINSLI